MKHYMHCTASISISANIKNTHQYIFHAEEMRICYVNPVYNLLTIQASNSIQKKA